MNENWPLWIFASIAKYFDDNISIHLFVDGDKRNTQDQKEWIELYVDGPDIQKMQGGKYKVDVTIHAMVCVIPSDSRYRRHELVGDVQTLFVTIPLKQTDETQFGCLYLTREGRPVTVLPIPPSEGSEIHMTQITGHYETWLEDS